MVVVSLQLETLRYNRYLHRYESRQLKTADPERCGRTAPARNSLCTYSEEHYPPKLAYTGPTRRTSSINSVSVLFPTDASAHPVWEVISGSDEL